MSMRGCESIHTHTELDKLKNKPLKLMTVRVRATHRDRVRGVSKPINLLVSKSSIPQDYYLSLESKFVQTPLLGLAGIGKKHLP